MIIIAGAMEWKLMWTKKCNGNLEATILSTNFDRSKTTREFGVF